MVYSNSIVGPLEKDMHKYAISALIGASLILLLPQLPAWWALCCSLVLAILFLLGSVYFKRQYPWLKSCGLSISCLILFFCYVCSTAHFRLDWQLPPSLENTPVLVQGEIVSLPEKDALHSSFLLSLSKLNQHIVANKIVKLSWYGYVPNLQVGDHWQLQVKLKRIHGLANPGGFDYQAYALQNNIHASGYVRNSQQNRLQGSNWYQHSVDRLREKLAKTIEVHLAASPYMGMIQALVIGDKSAINSQQWLVLQRTGTNHLMVIAGLHIGMLSGLLFLLTRFLWSRSRYLLLHLAAKQAAAIAAIATALSYSALAGFSIPTVRASIMVLVFMVTIVSKRYLSLGTGLAYAVILVLILFPLASLSVGFWLSFAAVSIIFYGMSARIHAHSLWWRWGRLQFVVSLGLIPFTLLLFQNASFISPLANAIVIPMVGFLVVPISLLASIIVWFWPLAGGFLYHVAAWILNVVWHILASLAVHPLFSWQHAIYSWWILIAAFIGVFILLAPRGLPAKYCGALCFLPLFFYQPASLAMGTARFTLLDVGQGLASVVQTTHHALVFDTGAKFGPNFDMGQAVVVPFLRSQGIQALDMMVISHGDNDHIGGAQSVLNALPVKEIRTSVPKRFTRPADLCLAGQHWQWDGVQFRFLYPDRAHLGLDNNSSCVLLVSAGNKHLLLTGDIEKPAELYLDQQDHNDLLANVIVAPHHGSKTSSTTEFLHAVAPQWVLYSVGYLNRYHFPSQVVMQRYTKMGIHDERTDSAGAISLMLAQNTPIKPISYRVSSVRFWRQ